MAITSKKKEPQQPAAAADGACAARSRCQHVSTQGLAAGTQSSGAGLKSSEQAFTSASLGWLLLFWPSSVLGRALTFLDCHPGK